MLAKRRAPAIRPLQVRRRAIDGDVVKPLLRIVARLMLVNWETRGPEAAEGRMTASDRVPDMRHRVACQCAKFCDGCGSPAKDVDTLAEYKQVTVLFADVVHSMDIAAAVGAERLREIMAELADRCAAVVKRFGGTVDKFTGDGIMAVFGAPVALEDHAVRACLAALGSRRRPAACRRS